MSAVRMPNRSAQAPGKTLVALLVMLVLTALVASGCARIPTSGPVGKSTDVGAGNANAPAFFPDAPQPGAAPESIIEGFYTAGSGFVDDYAVAREYLTQSKSVSWKPDARALVYRGAQVVPTDVENVFNYVLDIAYSVDANGIATFAPEGTKENIPVTLTQVEGEWRISEVPDGTAISESTFKSIYGAYPIYFYDPTYTYAIPDMRWFIRNKTVKAMTSALLAGPAPYLQGAAVSAFPAGMRLARESVPVVSGAAQVDLSARELTESSTQDRLRMQTQLVLTFRTQPDVVSVELRADHDLVRVEDDGTVLPPIINQEVPPRQIAVVGNELVRFENNQVRPLPEMRSAAEFKPAFPAESPVSQSVAFLNESRTTLYTMVPGQPARAVTTRSTLTRPSFGPNDWVWSAGPNATGAAEIVAYKPTGTAEGADLPSVTIAPAWLAGRTVKDVRISREGVRALVISEQNGQTRVQVAGIIRTPDGTPRELTVPVTLDPASTADQGVWVDDSTVAVMKPSPSANVTPELLSLTLTEQQPLAPWPGLLSLSAGNGLDEIYVQSAEGIFQRLGNGWSPQLSGPVHPSFPG
ncbi:LpqB family beta-propeller domain-containing protein [Pseudarthrobacter sp. J64]|uniref:LpqB family beta-propeller domain-containing protein n=1 Tax=Pseudarthrobacter sp. J64 TaxID=3116485 RepID=UPI002E80BE0C|nr:LpqB family beta-propeller domain-containing protein [Pseudarthrobacter sp. J64]MEE2568294.1 LpqB family beta-propeller domain-containing protein [Pseudarthrobacter sp. J64]